MFSSPCPSPTPSNRQDAAVAKRFLCKAMIAAHNLEPRLIKVDKNAAYSKAIDELKEKKQLSEKVELRQNKDLNNRTLAGR